MSPRRLRAALLIVLQLLALWYTSPERLFPECRGTSVPRHCVD